MQTRGVDTPVCYHPRFVISSVPLEVTITLTSREVLDAYTARRAPAPRDPRVSVPRQSACIPARLAAGHLPAHADRRYQQLLRFRVGHWTAGQGCLCCEYYCYGADPLLEMDPKQLVRHSLDYCVASGLMELDSRDEPVLELSGVDASRNRRNRIRSMRLGLLDEIEPYKNPYPRPTAHTDSDTATLAGLESAEAILSGDRTTSARHFDPAEVGIRSKPKAFEFELPQTSAS